jgi:exosortase
MPGDGLRGAIVASAACMLALLWAYWTTLSSMAERWARDPEYSHGYLVPMFAAALLWLRRDQLPRNRIAPSLWGLAVLSAGLGLRFVGARYHVLWLDSISLIPSFVGIALLALGRHALRWCWPSAAFLIFMMPLPYSLEVALRDPLRTAGTLASTYLMQTIGLPALAEGTTIVVNEARIGVVEACSGLRMLMIFFAFSTAVAIVGHRMLWERILIVLSALPIALACNVLRITVTGALYGSGQDKLADLVFHDLAGWLMMPLALGLLWLELKLLSHIVIVEESRPLEISLGAPQLGTLSPRT